MNAKNCVFVGNAQSVFVSRTQKKLSESGFNVEIIDTSKPLPGKGSTSNSALGRLIRRARDVVASLECISTKETAVIHSLTPHLVWLAPLLSIHFERVILICYGSDVLQRKKTRDPGVRFGLRFIDGIAATNDNVLSILLRDFRLLRKKEHRILRFGLPVLDAIDEANKSQEEAKRTFELDPQKTCVSLGYASTRGQRQRDLITYFSERAHLFPHIQFIVPSQYGEEDEMRAIRELFEVKALNKTAGNFTLIEEFYCEKKTALMRLATDLLVNHSISDSFSGTVQEVIYSGNLVMACDHLPYSTMPGYGSSIKVYNKLDDLAIGLGEKELEQWKLESTITRLKNSKDISDLSSWRSVLKDWDEFISKPVPFEAY